MTETQKRIPRQNKHREVMSEIITRDNRTT